MASSQDDDDYAPRFFSSLPLIDALVSAIEGAIATHDFVMVACLALQLSHLLHKFHWFPYAIHFDDLAIDALEALPTSEISSHRELRLTVYRQAALDHLLLGHLDDAAERFVVALGLLTDEISPEFRAALEWDASVLAQWRNEPIAGLDLAVRALDYYRSHDHPNELCRLRLHIADLAMDILTKDSPQGLCEPSLQTQAYLDLAIEHLAAAHPAPGSGFAIEIEITYDLAAARLSRLQDLPEDRFTVIQGVVRQAKAMRLKPALGQALIALADELSATGDFDEARKRYREAVDVLKGSLAPGLALIPARKLRRLEEFLDTDL